jgi:hypothetical protein
MRDIIDRLKQTIAGVPQEQLQLVNVSVPASAIDWAIKEIEHLRSLAGAVSQGESFGEIAAKAGRQPQRRD